MKNRKRPLQLAASFLSCPLFWNSDNVAVSRRKGNAMIRSTTALATLLWATAAQCQASLPSAPPGSLKAAAPAEPSAYCRAGAAALFQGSGEAELAAVQQNCRRGDVIAISAAGQGSTFQIGRLCDFTKAIVNAGGQIVCVLSGTRPIR
jgi:hypothetical protein